MRKNVGDLYDEAINKCKGKNVGDIMCEKLKTLNGTKAEQILSLCNQASNIVVDLEGIVERLGLYKYARTFDDIEEKLKQTVKGLVLLSGDDIGIFYDSEATVREKRFIIAHEIGHCCLHGDTLKEGYIEYLHKDGFENEREKEASAFAARLLIPESSLMRLHSALLVPTVKDLAEMFLVPERLMEYRLDTLGLNYFATQGE